MSTQEVCGAHATGEASAPQPALFMVAHQGARRRRREVSTEGLDTIVRLMGRGGWPPWEDPASLTPRSTQEVVKSLQEERRRRVQGDLSEALGGERGVII